jgi:hypothetical protein
VPSDCRACWRAASTEAFALYVIVAGFGRAPKLFSKRAHHVSLRAERIVHNVSQACDAQPDGINFFYHGASGDSRPRHTLSAEAARTLRAEATAYARRPRRTLRSHDGQRASRELSVHAVALCASYPPLYCPGATRPRQARSRLTSRFRVASYCRRVGLVCD